MFVTLDWYILEVVQLQMTGVSCRNRVWGEEVAQHQSQLENSPYMSVGSRSRQINLEETKRTQSGIKPAYCVATEEINPATRDYRKLRFRAHQCQYYRTVSNCSAYPGLRQVCGRTKNILRDPWLLLLVRPNNLRGVHRPMHSSKRQIHYSKTKSEYLWKR